MLSIKRCRQPAKLCREETCKSSVSDVVDGVQAPELHGVLIGSPPSLAVGPSPVLAEGQAPSALQGCLSSMGTTQLLSLKTSSVAGMAS